MPKRQAEPVEIGDQRYYIDPRGRGEYLLPEHLVEHLEVQTPRPEERIEPGVVEEFEPGAQRRRAKCALEGCNRPARIRFCSFQHQQRFHNRAYKKRQRGLKRWITLVRGKPERFERPFPKSILTARRIFSEHISEGVCQFRGDSDFCPSVANPYADSSLPRCLIYAVYADDLIEMQARASGMPVQRRYTSADGYWRERLNGTEGTGSPQPPPV